MQFYQSQSSSQKRNFSNESNEKLSNDEILNLCVQKIGGQRIFYHATNKNNITSLKGGITFIDSMKNPKTQAGELGGGFYVGTTTEYANTYADTHFHQNGIIANINLQGGISKLKGIVADESIPVNGELDKEYHNKYDFIIPKNEAILFAKNKSNDLQIKFTQKGLEKNVLSATSFNNPQYSDVNPVRKLTKKEFSDAQITKEMRHDILLNGENPNYFLMKQQGDSTNTLFVKDYYTIRNIDAGNKDIQNYVHNELLAFDLYKYAGIKTPNYELFTMGNKHLVSSKLLPNFKHRIPLIDEYTTKEQRKEIFEGIGIDIILGAYDSIKNIGYSEEHAYRIDFGCSLGNRDTKSEGGMLPKTLDTTLDDFLAKNRELLGQLPNSEEREMIVEKVNEFYNKITTQEYFKMIIANSQTHKDTDELYNNIVSRCEMFINMNKAKNDFHNFSKEQKSSISEFCFPPQHEQEYNEATDEAKLEQAKLSFNKAFKGKIKDTEDGKQEIDNSYLFGSCLGYDFLVTQDETSIRLEPSNDYWHRDFLESQLTSFNKKLGAYGCEMVKKNNDYIIKVKDSGMGI